MMTRLLEPEYAPEAEANGQKDQWPPIKPAKDLLKSKPPMPPELIKGVLHQGCKLMVPRGSKSFKTWSLLDLALSVSSGAQWWGLDTVQGDVFTLTWNRLSPCFISG
jgi:RecA-family ATPase